MFTPQLIDQAICAYYLIGVQREDGKQRTLTKPAQLDGLSAVGVELERPE
jgi:hypothetical protein